MCLAGKRGDLRAGVFYDLNTSVMIRTLWFSRCEGENNDFFFSLFSAGHVLAEIFKYYKYGKHTNKHDNIIVVTNNRRT